MKINGKTNTDRKLSLYKKYSYKYIREIIQAVFLLGIIYVISNNTDVKSLILTSTLTGTVSFLVENFRTPEDKEGIQKSIVLSALTGIIRSGAF